MPNLEHLKILALGVEAWNEWRNSHRIVPDLSEADLSGRDLREVALTWTNLHRVNLSRTDLRGADLHKAFLGEARLEGANLGGVNLGGAVLRQADLRGVNLSGAMLADVDLFRADLRDSDLTRVVLVDSILDHADISGCCVYGMSVWNVRLEGVLQCDLIITRRDEPTITTDSLEVAQFIYLLSHNERIRQAIDTITSKVVLILGRFSPERKAVLDAIREELRRRNYLPVLFDWQKPSTRDITETVSLLAGMARFVIADITDAKSIQQELMAVVERLPSVPVQPLLLASQHEYGMFEHFRRYPWVLEPFRYDDIPTLLRSLTDKVIGPAEVKAREQTGR